MTDQPAFSKEELLSRMQNGWDSFNAYLDTLSPEQLTTPTDAGGWTAKDHIIHLSVWEGGMGALLNRQNRREYMGIDEGTWATHDDDQINAVIHRQHKDLPLADVLNTFRDTHQQLIETISSLTTEDLERPYNHYDSGSTHTDPVWHWIVGNTFGHYEMHQPWIAAIVNSAA